MYTNKHLYKMIFYIVTKYGCNSSHNDLWTPSSKLFTNYTEAYEHFLLVAPCIDRETEYYQEATQYINSSYDPNSTNNVYILIEYRCQLGDGDEGNYAKRPYGAVIARCGV